MAKRKRAIEKVRYSRTRVKFVPRKKTVKSDMYNDLYKQVREANERIRKLEKRYGDESWGIKKLARLDTENTRLLTSKNRIRISKNMTERELRILKKEVKDWLSLETSTIKGVENVKKRQIQNIKANLSDDEVELSNNEAEALYQMFDDRDFTSVIKNYSIPPSDLWVCIEEAKEKNVSESGWLDIIGRYINRESLDVDSDLRRSLLRIYDRYIIS